MSSIYTYDYLDRLSSYRSYSGGSQTDSATYVYDPLDRLISETETHPNQSAKTTAFTYQGIGNQLIEEKQSNSNGPITTKDYTYDAAGHRLTMTDTPNGGTSTTYTYGYDVHDSVSLLIDPNGNPKSSYGYSAYGDSDSKLSQGDADKNNPFNAFRYEGKRYDSGSGSMNMGARSFNTAADSFLQPDLYHGAVDNLGLSSDPLTQNRYSFAGGNPLSFVESDGHMVAADGGGGAWTGPADNNTTQSSTSSSSSGGGGGGHKDCGILGLGCTWIGQQTSQFVQGVGDGLGELWKGGVALGGIAVDCSAVGGIVDPGGCGKKMTAIGSYVWNHPGDFFGSMIDYKDLSQGNYAKWAGHLAPSIALAVATAGAGGAIAKGGEAAGLAAEGADAAGEAGVAASGAAGEAATAAGEAGVARAAEGAGEGVGDAAAGAEKAAAAAGSGGAEASAGAASAGAEGAAPSLRIYAAGGRAAAAEESGVLSPGASGKLFATDAQYEYGNIAQSNLAISARGENVAGFWEVPEEYSVRFSYVGRVQPIDLWEGGGREFTMEGSVPYDQLGPFQPIPWSAYGR